MKGQWIGKYTGTINGQIMVNIDEVQGHFEAVAYIHPDLEGVPASVAFMVTETKEANHTLEAAINAVNPQTGAQAHWNDIATMYDTSVNHPTHAIVELGLKNGILSIVSESNIGTKLVAKLTRSLSGEKSVLDSEQMTWLEYKNHVSKLKGDHRLFRGQEKPWKLVTSFHRRGRYRINEFVQKDVVQLHQRLSAITSHYFDMSQGDQRGAFYNLLQHHGYPTPLLDWSYSPYVAAFFAYRGVPVNYAGEERVRVYLFDNQAWQNTFPQILNLDPPFPHLSVMEFASIDIPRVVTQQAVTTVTNLDDIESYILWCERETKQRFLTAVDLLASDRDEVMKDLRYMGITAGTMLPGIDGVCEQYKEINFDG